MSRISREMARGLGALSSDLGSQTVQWNNITLACIPKQSIDAMTLGLGGSMLSSDATFIIADSEFPSTRRPLSKELLFHGAIRYWISNVNTSADGSYVRLDCQLPESKA